MQKLFGLLSILQIMISIIFGIIAIAINSVLLSLFYLFLTLIAIILIVYSFCTKCACKDKGCSHVFPALLAKLLPKRKIEKYTFWDYLGVAIGFLTIILFPQYWLYKNIYLMILFWILNLTAFVEIILFVCSNCSNFNCPMNKNQT
ncbi:hypothetical protein ACFL2K_01990 [Candidatus Margulisiibacteriota bacterium]